MRAGAERFGRSHALPTDRQVKDASLITVVKIVSHAEHEVSKPAEGDRYGLPAWSCHSRATSGSARALTQAIPSQRAHRSYTAKKRQAMSWLIDASNNQCVLGQEEKSKGETARGCDPSAPCSAFL